MKTVTKRAYVIIALIVFFFIGLGIMLYSFIAHGSDWATRSINTHIFTNRELTVAGKVLDRDGNVLSESVDGKRTFSQDYLTRVSTLHLVGDAQGYISSGVQYTYRPELIGYDFVQGIWPAIKKGAAVSVSLTVSAKINAAAWNALGGKGAVAAYNYKTGEIVCSVSRPSFDPLNKPSAETLENDPGYEGVYIDRVTNGLFTPGSVFKIVTATAAVENIPDIFDRTFTCTGVYHTDDGDIKCSNTAGHGTITFRQALNRSCNCAFAEIAIELGSKKLASYVKKLGLRSDLTVSRVDVTKSYFDLKGANKADLGWTGIGQGKTLVNPLRVLTLLGGIANGGRAVVPYMVKGGAEEKAWQGFRLSEETADTMNDLLRSNVSDYYGDGTFPGLTMAGKTGSAELDNAVSHAWFAGYSTDESFPYAIVVVAENAGWGFSKAMPAASAVMQAIKAAGL